MPQVGPTCHLVSPSGGILNVSRVRLGDNNNKLGMHLPPIVGLAWLLLCPQLLMFVADLTDVVRLWSPTVFITTRKTRT